MKLGFCDAILLTQRRPCFHEVMVAGSTVGVDVRFWGAWCGGYGEGVRPVNLGFAESSWPWDVPAGG